MQALRLALAVVTAPVVAAAQTTPPKRAHHALVYDEAAERVLLTGGSSPAPDGACCGFFNDLWSFNGTRWTSLAPSGDQMSGMRLAYDSRNKRVVSFGGYANRESRSDVRTLNGETWTTLGAHTLAAAEGGFVYDARRNRFVQFGGSAGRGQAHGETWEYDGSTWMRKDVVSPPARQMHVMVFDERRARTIVFGGMGTASPPNPPAQLGDTWEFDGERWTQADARGPSARSGAGAAYDSKRGLVILFGGSARDSMFADTWSWDGVTWKRLAEATPSGPPPRVMGYLAYDKKRDRVVLFGGRKGWPDDLNDTWEWDGSVWRRVGQ